MSFSYLKKDLLGSWEYVSSKVYDIEGNIVREGVEESPDHCKLLIITFDEETIKYFKYNGKDTEGNCLVLSKKVKYDLRNDCIYILDSEGELDLEERVVIKELSADTLSFYRRLVDPSISNGVALQGIELKLKKVK
ncbi:lipocalin family protein [Myroides odoratimimus]|uniref:lipocalin family protein n=1 Tax=Myroides odoratimimus TaxID=76832 RepID=UPI003306DA83